ncbi:MAG TPA: glycosyltransferase family 4 protein [Vicinamibacterales bacterium]|jgi:glycosyltransferase involved in cell wall biosynthesis|nr:glycosyltransferase family 4 protein [Vicinamibacterales bacterium]
MRLVFLNPSAQLGGAEGALYELLSALRAAHPAWSLGLVVAAEGPLVERVRALGLPVTVLLFPASLARLGDWGLGRGLAARLRMAAALGLAAVPAARYAWRLRRLVRREQPDVVHTNGLKMHVLGAWTRPRGAALLWHIHDYVSRRPLAARLLRQRARACAAIVANSQSVAADAGRAIGPGPTVHAVLNGVDLSRFSPDGSAADLDALAGLPPAGPSVVRVGLVATFARWKGHRTFLEALSRLPESLPVRGYVIGGPVYETAGSQVSLGELRAEAAALGLSSRVGFTGFVADAAPAMRALDIVVHASTDPEPFGLVIAEGMACARAVVVSRAGGAAEITTPGVDALAYAPGDADQLSECLLSLVTNAALRQRLGDAGRTTAERVFDRRRLALDMTPIYETLARLRP